MTPRKQLQRVCVWMSFVSTYLITIGIDDICKVCYTHHVDDTHNGWCIFNKNYPRAWILYTMCGMHIHTMGGVHSIKIIEGHVCYTQCVVCISSYYVKGHG